VFNLFLPGMASGPGADMPRLPALETILARARRHSLPASPWAELAALAEGQAEDWPVGPVSALGDLAVAPPCCLRLEPLGMDAEHSGAFRLPARVLGITRPEADALAASFSATFGADGLKLVIARPQRWYLVQQDGFSTGEPWRGFAMPARALPADARPAPPEAELSRLLSEVEMLFYSHPVNAARRDRAMPLIAGIHAWGGGRLHVPVTPAAHAPLAGEEPYLAGLRRLGAFPGSQSDSGRLAAGGAAWPVADEDMSMARLPDAERAWAGPLLRSLRLGRLSALAIVTGRTRHELRRRDLFKFWRRPRALEEQC
jgi:hypothetical protein